MVMETRGFCCRGIPWNKFGRGLDADDIRTAVETYNADIISRAKPLPANPTTAQFNNCTLFVNGVRMCGVRTPRNECIPANLPAA